MRKIGKNIYSEINEILGSNYTWKEICNLGLDNDFLKEFSLNFTGLDKRVECVIYSGKEIDWSKKILSKEHSEDFFKYHIQDLPGQDLPDLIFLSGRLWKKSTLDVFFTRLSPNMLNYYWSRITECRICSDFLVF